MNHSSYFDTPLFSSSCMHLLFLYMKTARLHLFSLPEDFPNLIIGLEVFQTKT